MKFGQWVLLCPRIPHSEHFGRARDRDFWPFGWPVGSPSWGWVWGSISFRVNCSSLAALKPSDRMISCLDRACFRFSFSLVARKSWFSWANRATYCIVISKPLISWSIGFDWLYGLIERYFNSFLIKEACRWSYLIVLGILGVKFRLESLPRLTGGIGVRSWISSFEITRSGSYGTKPVATKLLLIIFDLNTSFRAIGNASRKSNLSIWLKLCCIRVLTS